MVESRLVLKLNHVKLADGNPRGEAIAREQLQGTVKGELLGVVRRGSSTDDHLARDLLDDEIPNPAVGRLPDSVFDPLREAGAEPQSIFGSDFSHRRYT
jgi:hypothetical protein